MGGGTQLPGWGASGGYTVTFTAVVVEPRIFSGWQLAEITASERCRCETHCQLFNLDFMTVCRSDTLTHTFEGLQLQQPRMHGERILIYP